MGQNNQNLLFHILNRSITRSISLANQLLGYDSNCVTSTTAAIHGCVMERNNYFFSQELYSRSPNSEVTHLIRIQTTCLFCLRLLSTFGRRSNGCYGDDVIYTWSCSLVTHWTKSYQLYIIPWKSLM